MLAWCNRGVVLHVQRRMRRRGIVGIVFSTGTKAVRKQITQRGTTLHPRVVSRGTTRWMDGLTEGAMDLAAPYPQLVPYLNQS